MREFYDVDGYLRIMDLQGRGFLWVQGVFFFFFLRWNKFEFGEKKLGFYD